MLLFISKNDNIIGPIEIIEGRIEKAQKVKSDNSFNYLLSDTRKNLFSSYVEINNALYLINSGDLIVYDKKKNYNLKTYPNIISITQNCLGTYGRGVWF